MDAVPATNMKDAITSDATPKVFMTLPSGWKMLAEPRPHGGWLLWANHTAHDCVLNDYHFVNIQYHNARLLSLYFSKFI